MKYKSFFSSLFVTILMLIAISGCEVLDRLDGTTINGNFAATFLTQYATLKYVETDQNNIDVVKANKVYDHAVDVLRYLDSDIEISIDELESYVVSKVDWGDMSPADTVAARTFINFLSAELKQKVNEIEEETGVIQDKLVVAREIVEIVIGTLEPYET